MAEQPELEARVAALEVRMEEVAADAAAARHLAAARDRDIADLGIKVDANRSAINALGVQTAARFDRLEHNVAGLREQVDTGFARVDNGFAQIRGRLDEFATAQQHVIGLLNTLIDQPGDSG
jgi:outer membrane murein-binding lipoprotein Lpp